MLYKEKTIVLVLRNGNGFLIFPKGVDNIIYCRWICGDIYVDGRIFDSAFLVKV
jgi:hypothetical protein